MKTFPVYKFGVERPNATAKASFLASAPSPEHYNKNYLKGKRKPVWYVKPASPFVSSTPAGVPVAQGSDTKAAPARLYNADYLKSDGSKPKPQKYKAWSEEYAKSMLEDSQPDGESKASDSNTPPVPPSKLTVQAVIDGLKLLAETDLTDAQETQLKQYAVELSVLLASEKKGGLDDAQMRQLEAINADVSKLMSSIINQQKMGIPFPVKDKSKAKIDKIKKALSEVVLTTTKSEADKKEQARLINSIMQQKDNIQDDYFRKLSGFWDKQAMPDMRRMAEDYLKKEERQEREEREEEESPDSNLQLPPVEIPNTPDSPLGGVGSDVDESVLKEGLKSLLNGREVDDSELIASFEQSYDSNDDDSLKEFYKMLKRIGPRRKGFGIEEKINMITQVIGEDVAKKLKSMIGRKGRPARIEAKPPITPAPKTRTPKRRLTFSRART